MARQAVVAVLAMLALGAPGCNKRAPGTCRDDVDCPPGFDCRSGGCARRERMTFTGPGGAAVAPAAEPAVEAPAPPAPRPGDLTAPASPVPARPVAKPKPAPPVELAPPARPEQRLPEWKQRLKNS